MATCRRAAFRYVFRENQLVAFQFANLALIRHSLPPDGCTRRKRPPASPSLYGFSRGFAFLIAVSVSAMGATVPCPDYLAPDLVPIPRDCRKDYARPGGPLRHGILRFMRVCKGLCTTSRYEKWCPGAESNHRHHDFQSCALPTELPGRSLWRRSLKRYPRDRPAVGCGPMAKRVRLGNPQIAVNIQSSCGSFGKLGGPGRA